MPRAGVAQPYYTNFFLDAAPGRTHWYYSGVPLYPFGFGLSYANFTYSDLAVTPSTLAPTDEAFVVSGACVCVLAPACSMGARRGVCEPRAQPSPPPRAPGKTTRSALSMCRVS